MRVSEIRLHDFRNYEDLQAVFSDGIHVLAGKNAQGKTNLLEALLYLSTTRSHRTNTDKDLIREKSEAFFIRAKIEKEHKKEDIQITVNEKGKNLFIYQNPVNRVSDFIGEFNAVMFCPDDMSLFNASPRVRRRFAFKFEIITLLEKGCKNNCFGSDGQRTCISFCMSPCFLCSFIFLPQKK